MQEILFVYGTLKDPEIQQHLVGRTIPGTPDRLRGYRSHNLLNYPTALPDSAGWVHGLVLSITPQEMMRFDEYEGMAYERVRICLDSGTEAWMYRGKPEIFDRVLNG
jgi:gamma-glutamylcyclotransferase (GGCT)/AIG2-like uncharacterized protein YtfP